MKRKACRTKVKPKMLVEGTNRFFHKAFRHIKSFVLGGYQKLFRNPFADHIFYGSNKIGRKLQEVDDFWGSNEVGNKKEHAKGDEQCSKNSMSFLDQSRLEDLKDQEEERMEEEPSFLATENFAQKMEELQKMDVNDGSHVLDIEEVVHYYSLLTSPAYLEIVDKFFKDVYLELNLPRPSRSVNSSVRKLASGGVHSSMRKLGSASVHGSMRKLGSTSVHGSTRKLGSTSVHGSTRKFGSARVHGSMRKVESARIHGSMRNLGSDCIHSSMRSFSPLKL